MLAQRVSEAFSAEVQNGYGRNKIIDHDPIKENARKKLRSKNLDFIVLNSLQDPGAGFGHDTNKIRIISKRAPEKNFPLKSKM